MNEHGQATRSDARQAEVLDALPQHVALIDADGVIVWVNVAWQQFALANVSVFHASANAVGRNYLGVCDDVSGDDAAQAGRVAVGIRSVLRGASKSYSIEHSGARVVHRAADGAEQGAGLARAVAVAASGPDGSASRATAARAAKGRSLRVDIASLITMT
jgi:hypothetical protein